MVGQGTPLTCHLLPLYTPALTSHTPSSLHLHLHLPHIPPPVHPCSCADLASRIRHSVCALVAPRHVVPSLAGAFDTCLARGAQVSRDDEHRTIQPQNAA